jgi:hypothetical protein
MPNEQDEASQDYESPAILLDKDGLHLASVTAKISPKQNCGDFRLASSADVHQILTKATSLQMKGSKQLQLIRLQRCTAFHLENPEQAHLEFDYKAD